MAADWREGIAIPVEQKAHIVLKESWQYKRYFAGCIASLRARYADKVPSTEMNETGRRPT